MKDNREALRPYIADMAAVEKHILEALERQRNDDDIKQFPEAFQLVGRIEGVLRRHVEELEKHVEGFSGGGVATTLKEAVTGILGAVAGVYDKVRKDTASRALRDDYTALSLAAISYTMLHATALGLNQGMTAQIALSNLKDLTPLIVELSQVIPPVVVKELTLEGYSMEPGVGQQAARNTHEAWSREHVGTSAGAGAAYAGGSGGSFSH
jgi:ferritin-like metal-binding protein YciE